MPLVASSGFSINSLLWIRSLPESELGPTRRVLEDLQPFFEELNLRFQLYDVNTPADLYRVLDSLVDSRVKPILQLDMHGTKDGLILTGAGEVAPWGQVVPRLRAVNVASGGNLCVVAGVCFAFYAIMKTSIMEASPVNILIAPDREVQARVPENGLLGFYKDLFSGGEISIAFEKHLGEPFKVFLAERFFVISVARYIRNHCKGQGGDARRERLLTEVLLEGQPRTPENLRRIRRQIKMGIRPGYDLISPCWIDTLTGFCSAGRVHSQWKN